MISTLKLAFTPNRCERKFQSGSLRSGSVVKVVKKDGIGYEQL